MYTVDDLITEFRDLIDEDSSVDLTPAETLRWLNRSQREFQRLASRRYPDLFKLEGTATSSGNAATIPENMFGHILTSVEVIFGGEYYTVWPRERMAVKQLAGSARALIPAYYVQLGNSIELYPQPSANVTVYFRGQKRIPNLVTQQGRITTVDSANTQVYLDDIGSDLTTSVAALGAFVNLVDSTTGLIKATLQVSSIDTTNNIVAFKTSGLARSTVYGLTVDTSLPSTLAQDDYICLASGVCVPYLSKDYSDWVIYDAAIKFTQWKQREPTTEMRESFSEIRMSIERLWAGRSQSKRVVNTAKHWNKRRPRWR